MKPWGKRFGWLLLIWLGSVGILGLIALFFRFLMAAAGFKA